LIVIIYFELYYTDGADRGLVNIAQFG